MTPEPFLLGAVVGVFIAAVLRSILLHLTEIGSPAATPVRRIMRGMAVLVIVCTVAAAANAIPTLI
jgi:hypothetical protein